MHGAETGDRRPKTEDRRLRLRVELELALPALDFQLIPASYLKVIAATTATKQQDEHKVKKWNCRAAKENLIRKLCAQVERAALEVRTSDTKPYALNLPSCHLAKAIADLHIKCREVIF